MSLGDLFPLCSCWGLDISLPADNYLEIMRNLHLWVAGHCLYCFPGAASRLGWGFYLFTNNCRPWKDPNQSFEGDKAGKMLDEQPDLPMPYFLRIIEWFGL